jgi:glycogen debranching enzyme
MKRFTMATSGHSSSSNLRFLKARRAQQKRSQEGNTPKQQRKRRVLIQGTPSMVRSIADAVVIKNQNLFFLAQPDGDVPLRQGHGLGLYYNDCRYLNGYVMKLGGIHLTPLIATASQGFAAVFQLTNQDTVMPDGGLIPQDSIGVRWERLVDSSRLALHELIEFQNFGLQPVELQLTLLFRAGFEDVFSVRELIHEMPGRARRSRWIKDALVFRYDGADGLHRGLVVRFSPKPEAGKQNKAIFQLRVDPREKKQIALALCVIESENKINVAADFGACPDPKGVYATLKSESETWLRRPTEIFTSSLALNRILQRSMRDFHVLQNKLGSEAYIAAGVPWFVTLFGRDSLISSLQMLAYDRSFAEQTLRLLAKYQGRELNSWRDEEPGKILHELRFGELANLNEIPHTPYYGTVDATLLFLILLGRHASWTGDLALFSALEENVEQALSWIDNYGDANGDGYIEYHRKSEKGLSNQGWKDSGDAIVNEDGSLANPPISLVEVQGYLYLARTLMAELFRRAGKADRAGTLKRQAGDLRLRFNKDFWVVEKNIYALALQEGGKPVSVVSSNAAHALWSGIAEEEKARKIAQRIMLDDMFSGWGVRTLATSELRYNPVGYHVGSVWPHDNSMIAAGLRRYGFDEPALRIFNGMVEAAMHLDHTLPELFSGFSREDYGEPVRYPVACHPQAWAAVAIPYLLQNLLGLFPQAFEKQLRIVHPVLPEFIKNVEIHRLGVGGASADLRFELTSHGVATEVLKIVGELDVVIDDASR